MGQFWYFGGGGNAKRQVNSKLILNQEIICAFISGQQGCWMPAGTSK